MKIQVQGARSIPHVRASLRRRMSGTATPSSESFCRIMAFKQRNSLTTDAEAHAKSSSAAAKAAVAPSAVKAVRSTELAQNENRQACDVETAAEEVQEDDKFGDVTEARASAMEDKEERIAGEGASLKPIEEDGNGGTKHTISAEEEQGAERQGHDSFGAAANRGGSEAGPNQPIDFISPKENWKEVLFTCQENGELRDDLIEYDGDEEHSAESEDIDDSCWVRSHNFVAHGGHQTAPQIPFPIKPKALNGPYIPPIISPHKRPFSATNLKLSNGNPGAVKYPSANGNPEMKHAFIRKLPAGLAPK